MIGWEYPPHNSGGLGTACAGLTKALALNNTQIYFTLPYHFSKKLAHMQILDCYDPKWKDHTQPPFEAYGTNKAVRLDQLIDSQQLSALPTSELEQKVERYSQLVTQQAKKISNDFDVIHAHDWMAFPAAMNLKQKTGKPMIAQIHSTEFDRIPNGNGSHYITHTEYQGMQLADKIIAVSYYTKKLLIDKYQIDPAKIEVVHNGIFYQAIKADPDSFAQKRPIVSFMGRLTSQKGPEFFLQVAQAILAKMPNCLFIMAGSGDMYHELLLKTANSQLSANLLFSGFVRDKQRAKLLARTDVFIMPSVSEPFGLVAVEAALRHTPVVVSKTAGVSEVMPSSIAIDFWDVDKMADVVVSLLQDQGFYNQVAKKQLRELKTASWQNSAEKIKKIYRNVFLGA